MARIFVFDKSNHFNAREESGFALIMTVFIVALATILVLDFASETLAFQQNSRASTERIEASYILKSTINVAKLLLELPKLQISESGETKQTREDWLGEPWALIAAVPSLPLPGGPRLTISDESGKLNLTSIVAQTQGSSGPPAPGATPVPTPTPQEDANGFWKDKLSELFERTGFQRTPYDSDLNRTLGDTGYAATDQVAVLHDWQDADSDSHVSGTFPGEGIESFADKTWFYNRPLRNLSELALVPGMTLERVQFIAPFVRVSRTNLAGSSRVNVNTAPLEVLLALGFPESRAVEIDQIRTNAPISSADLQQLVAGDPQLAQSTTVSSQEFTAYAQIRLANSSNWAKAVISVQGGGQSRRAVITSLEIF